MLSIRLSKEVEENINRVSAKMRTTKAAFLRKAIIEYLEDVEDYLMAIDALKEMEKLESGGQKTTYTLEEIQEMYKNDL